MVLEQSMTVQLDQFVGEMQERSLGQEKGRGESFDLEAGLESGVDFGHLDP